METKEAVEFLEGQKNKSEDPVEPNRLGINLTIDNIIELLQRGEKYEAIVNEIDERLIPGTPIPYHNDLNITDLSTLNFIKLIIKDIKQKYFPSPVKKTITMTQREIYPWWNCLSKDEKMEVYFKYYSSGTYDDCIEWWDRIDIILKIFVHDTWCEKGGTND